MKKKISIVIFVLGLLMLAAGATMLALKMTKTPPVSDGEYLTQFDEWVLIDCESEEEECWRVIWEFTEIGKGVLTTNNGVNKYNFVWAIDGDKLTVMTDWLYELHNEYTYKIDRENKSLTLIDDTGEKILAGHNYDVNIPVVDVENVE